MKSDKAKELIESSFLKPLLLDKNITDISYNGVDIFYQHNDFGRKISNIKVDQQEVFDFIRQLANLSEKFFSTTEPILDISVDKYRINAVHYSIARVGNSKAITFSIRIASKKIRIVQGSDFMPIEVAKLLQKIIYANQSIVIAGLTGTGKTELQKFLLSNMKDNTRIVIIDNVLELDQIRVNKNLDINSWQFDDKNKQISISYLIKNALRSNPDWLIVAEARGKEMIDVLNSALTGIPIITTLHSESVNTVISRMTSMIKMNDDKMDVLDIQKDIYSHIHFYIYIKKKVLKNGFIQRFISDVSYIDENGQHYCLYSYEKSNQKVILNEQLKALLNYESKEEN